jgi:alpha-L-fucosidase
LGQRIKTFSIEAYIDDDYIETASGSTIGNRRIVKFETVTTSRLKINLEAKACPLISNIEVYYVSEITGNNIIDNHGAANAN